MTKVGNPSLRACISLYFGGEAIRLSLSGLLRRQVVICTINIRFAKTDLPSLLFRPSAVLKLLFQRFKKVAVGLVAAVIWEHTISLAVRRPVLGDAGAAVSVIGAIFVGAGARMGIGTFFHMSILAQNFLTVKYFVLTLRNLICIALRVEISIGLGLCDCKQSRDTHLIRLDTPLKNLNRFGHATASSRATLTSFDYENKTTILFYYNSGNTGARPCEFLRQSKRDRTC